MSKHFLQNYRRAEKTWALLIFLAFIFYIAVYPVSVLAYKETVRMIVEAQHPMTINLSFNYIGAEGAVAIANAIAKAQHPMTIDLSGNGFGAKGAKAIAKAIAKAQHPMTIDLSFNYIGAEGAVAIANAIAKAQHPMTINLEGNNIGDEGATAIAGAIANAQHPMTIDLRYNKIGVKGATAIAGAIANAQHPMTIDLRYNKISAESATAIANAIAKAHHPMTINLEGNNIGAEGATAIAGAIANAQHPMTINLSFNYIGAEGAVAIANAIAKAQHPMTIDLSGNGFDAKDAKAIAKAIAKAQHPMTIDLRHLRYNEIDDDKGAKAIAKAIAKAQHPMTIDLRYNKIGKKGTTAIADALAVRILRHEVLFLQKGFNTLYKKARRKVRNNLLDIALGLRGLELPHEIIYEILMYFVAAPTKEERKKLFEFPNYLDELVTKVKKVSVGPREIDGWILKDVEGDGNCFYRATADQLMRFFSSHEVVTNLQQGTDLRNVLRIRAEGGTFEDGRFSDHREIISLARELNVVIAIVDTRDPNHSFYYHYIDGQDNYQSTGDLNVIPNIPTIRLAYTGNHYLSVINSPSNENQTVVLNNNNNNNNNNTETDPTSET